MKTTRWIEIAGALLLIGAGLIALLENLGLPFGLGPILWTALFLGESTLFLWAFFVGRVHWWSLIVGCAFAGVGMASLLSDVLYLPGAVGGAAFFAALTAAFAGIYLLDRRGNWWALISGGAMATLGLVALLSSMGDLAGVVFFAGLGLIFIALYFVEIDGRRYNWWTLIPAGALLSLAAVVVLSTLDYGGAAGAALFLGLGVTFGVLYLMRGPDRPLGWAWIPSVALLAFGTFILAVAGDLPYNRLFWPLGLIIAGLLLLFANWRRLGTPMG